MSDLPDPRHWLDMIARHADLPLERLGLEKAQAGSGPIYYRLAVLNHPDGESARYPLGPGWRAREAMGHILAALYNSTKERQETLDMLKEVLGQEGEDQEAIDHLRAITDKRRKSLMLGPVA